MKPGEIIEKISLLLEKSGSVARFVPVKHLKELEGELAVKHKNGCFSEDFYNERLTSFKFEIPTTFIEAKSIIIIAVPQPAVILLFRRNDIDQQVLIPPTYDYSSNTEMKKKLEDILIPEGFNLLTSFLPLKLLAVKSGLADYGRNNLCYIPGRGSFFRLMAFYTDLFCLEHIWRQPVMMNKCLKCKACLINCPLGAIDERRFLLQAERCLTFHNEHAGDFPAHIDKSFHHCLFGCLRCQVVCPENRKYLQWMEMREQFSELETLMILKGLPLDQIPASTRIKLDKLGLIDDYPLLARNLGAVLS